MFEQVDKIQAELEEYRKVLNWIIGGSGIHGFKIKDAPILSWDYIKTYYNVDEK